MKAGIVLLAELVGPVADQIHEIQERFDPRMARELPPHITLSGSSGMGPIPVSTSVETLRAALEPIASDISPLTIKFLPPIKFMQSNVVVLPVDPHGPIRALHDRIKTSGVPFEKPRFAFTPHCTLSFYPELSRDRVMHLLSLRFDEPVVIDRITAFRASSPMRTENVLELPLTGA